MPPKPNAKPTATHSGAVVYARVSSKDQEREGFSIPAQLQLLRGYANSRSFDVLQEFIDVETAKQAGRTGFGEMLAFLRRNKTCRILLVEKTDRLYRNLKDWVTLDELGLEIHLVKENIVISQDSRSSEKFMHGIKVLMAKNYIDNLSEETKKGMLEKARQGIWPSFAPMGYLNVMGQDGKRTIQPDPVVAPMIRTMFERYASGNYNLKQIATLARADGLAFRKTRNPVPVSTVSLLLRNRIFSGDFDFDGQTYKGTHEPIVSRELWDQVQMVLAGKRAKSAKMRTHEFAFSGLLSCGHCGCSPAWIRTTMKTTLLESVIYRQQKGRYGRNGLKRRPSVQHRYSLVLGVQGWREILRDRAGRPEVRHCDRCGPATSLYCVRK